MGHLNSLEVALVPGAEVWQTGVHFFVHTCTLFHGRQVTNSLYFKSFVANYVFFLKSQHFFSLKSKEFFEFIEYTYLFTFYFGDGI